MTRDAEKMLKYIVDKSNKDNETKVSIEINELKNIPNVRIVKNKLLAELQAEGVISEYKENILGELFVYLTTDGLEYFYREEKKDTMCNNGMVINMSGGQFNFAKDNAIINVTQNNGVNSKELDDIINGIIENLSDLKKEDADRIVDIVEMTKNELMKPDPRVSRLKDCLNSIAPMFTIANGIPTLAANLHDLWKFIMQYIR